MNLCKAVYSYLCVLCIRIKVNGIPTMFLTVETLLKPYIVHELNMKSFKMNIFVSNKNIIILNLLITNR